MEIQNLNGDHEEEIKKKMMKKKRSRGLHVIGVFLYMLRRKRRRKPFNNGGFWRRVIESVRLLKDENITILPSSNITILPSSSPVNNGSEHEDPEHMTSENTGLVSVDSVDRLSDMVEVFTATTSSCSSSGIAGYGSAKSLRDMDCLDENDDDDYEDDDEDECYGDADEGDEMIDEKAEEFILRFYEQMRMQNQAYTERYKAKGMMVV